MNTIIRRHPGASTFVAIIALLCLGDARPADLGVLTPVIEAGELMQKADASGRAFPVLERVREGALFDLLQREAKAGFTATVLRLDEIAQRTAGATSISPSWLYLSGEDGGFARVGFWLREGGEDRFVGEPFVDLVVDEGSIESGSFEEIFAHEMGHVFLRRLLPSLPHGHSRAAHHSFSITDYPTAFDEGFAIHMQGLVRRWTENRHLRDEDLGLTYKPLVNYWLSNLDRTMRIEGMRRNLFVHAQVPMSGADREMVLTDLSTQLDMSRLKSGNQMLACEGVIATLFYRWLVPGVADEKALLARYEQLFAALRTMNERDLQPDSLVYLDLIEALHELHPQAGARVIALTVDTTYGATADPTFAASVEALAADGRVGNIEAFIERLGAARKQLGALSETAKRDPKRLRAALGPDLWLLIPGEPAVSINLNTAQRAHLLEIPGMDETSVERALQSRRRDGAFKSLADFRQRSGIPAAVAERIESAAQEMQRAGVYPRR